ncbi:MAG TPA: ribonuclease Z [Panacibacter sp.]|nr:ribonuclease Z [Panacibacter sp.]
MFGVTILGNNSALPAYDRHPTAQVVTLNDQLFLIDCGEGTQMQLSRYKIRRSRINHIFISHLHGDHYLGLTGILTSFGLMNREADLHLHAPEKLKQILDLQFAAADTRLPYTIHFHPLKSVGGLIVDEDKFSVECFKVYHRIDCWGFIIREKKKPRKIDKATILNYEIPATFYEKLKDGEDYATLNGELIKNETVTIPNTPNRSYGFCADTIYDESICTHLKNINLLYHETTYLKDLEDRAASRFHSTTVQAGNIALLANAKGLLIGHFSSKYEKLDDFLTETSEVFPDTLLAIEGVTYIIS